MMQNIMVSLQELCFGLCRIDVNHITVLRNTRVLSGDKVTLIVQRKVDSNNNGDTSTGPVRVGHTQIKKYAEIQGQNNSSELCT